MERSRNKQKTTANSLTNENLLANVSEIVGRANLATQMGQQYGGDRDIYQALGYPTNIPFADYFGKYKRQDIAKAIINRPVNAMWKGVVSIIETNDDQDTALEIAYKELEDFLHIKSKYIRVDKLAGIGEYGVLLLGLNDVASIDEFTNPVVPSTSLKLLYIKPLSQNSAQILSYYKDPSQDKYGKPEFYQIQMTGEAVASVTSVKVHESRVIHIVDEILEDENKSAPRLEDVYNRLIDLEKLVGGSAEMFWRGARPGYQGKVDKDYEMTPTEQAKLQDQIDEYEHNLRRLLVNQGVDYTALAQQVADPSAHVDVQIQMISAAKHIPKRILTGSERGELSSGQDSDEWDTYVGSRREEFAEPQIVRPFVDRLIAFKVLPSPAKGYSVQWVDLFAKSDKSKAEVGKIRAEALKAWATIPGIETIMPFAAFLDMYSGFTKEQITLILEMQEQALKDEENDMVGEEEVLLEAQRLEEEARLADEIEKVEE